MSVAFPEVSSPSFLPLLRPELSSSGIASPVIVSGRTMETGPHCPPSCMPLPARSAAWPPLTGYETKLENSRSATP